MINKIHNEDCTQTMKRLKENNIQVDIILTSPPYSTSRGYYNDKGLEENQRKYDSYTDRMTTEEYSDWLVDKFKCFDTCLAENGVIIMNLSYSNDIKGKDSGLDRLFISLVSVIESTNFTLVDKIVWKKDRAIPNNASANKLTRITEDVYIFSRKKERYTYKANKGISKISEKTGQTYYKSVWNFIEAKNNDGKCILNKATYSVELCDKLLDIYASKNTLVYDPFSGTGTTAIACIRRGLNFICSEISKAQCDYADERVKKQIY